MNSLPPRRGGPTIGVLGGIASGKSLAARLLAGSDGVVIDADRHARAALQSPELGARLVEAFGAGVLGPDGAPDRAAIAERVFRDPEAKRRLESWIHPSVRARMRAELDDARAAGRGPIVLDVPLLLENDAHHGLVQECDFLVYVDSEPDVRDARAVANRGWEPGEVARRESTQLPQSAKRARARYVIDNRGEPSELESAVREILAAEGLRR
ncbi:MAG: dephospho-CoA kinase [Planctomycetes bacterium]|nr:dephospho-CoA kinase [Planctomycetota bacterium]